MYAIGRKVIITDKGFDNAEGVITEANMVPFKDSRKALYLVSYGKGQDYLCSKDSLRAYDTWCDACGKPRRDSQMHTQYYRGEPVLGICWLCEELSRREPPKDQHDYEPTYGVGYPD